MPKRRPTIPIAHADDLPTIEFNDEQWQAIERAYGRQLNAEMRQQIATVTTQYLKDCVFERAAAPKEMVREHIERIHRAAGDLERAMLGPEAFSASFDELSIEQRQSAHSYADSLIRRHLVPSPQWEIDSALHVRPALMSHIANIIDAQLGVRRYSFDAQCNRQRLARDRLHHFRSALKSFVVACDCALKDLSATKNCADEPWNWWIQGLTQIAREHGLPAGARIVEASGEPSPFVALVRALQEHVPARHTLSCEALAKAIRRAQRRAGDK